ncbi:hypothetical protein IJJ53_02525, partial [Candidatus Saccharibacteria bacterium]|nr:hypothetical protein [Candidatus Saccharibacteria bacterium]
AKLADGKIWMTKNLNLAGDTEITSELSDIPENYTLPTANGFQEGNRLPASSQTGFNDNAMAYVYNTDDCDSNGCYSYYSWVAATVGSGVNITTNNTDAPYSICPKGWKLPNTRTGKNSSADLRALAIAYGGSDSIVTYDETTLPTGSTLYRTIGPGTVANFLRIYRNANGYYWSSTSLTDIRSQILRLRDAYMYFAESSARKETLAIRCLAR